MYESANNIDHWIIKNLDELYRAYQEYRITTLADDDYFAFGEFCIIEYHDQ